MTASTDSTDDMTELHDATFPRVDLVGKAANGTEFLIAKARSEGHGANLFEADFVRDLVTKSDGQEASMTASVTDAPAATVEKAEGGDLDAGTVLAEPEAAVSGSETMPGSPAWEATDAATARKWTAILSRAKNALEVLSNREQVESATGEGDLDAIGNSFDLDDAACAIDYAIGVLAPYAAGEQAEADIATEGVELVGKSMAGFDLEALDTLEGLAPVMKAGRSLSAANEAKIRGAVDSLQTVLNSLPAPTEDVTKQTEPEPAAAPAEEPANFDAALDRVRKALESGATVQITENGATEDVMKAKGDPQVAVYDADGKLIGTVDQSNLTPLAAAEPPEGSETKPTDPASLAPAPAATVGTPAAAAPAAAAAAPAAVGAPAVAKEAAPQDPVPASTVEAIVKAALEAREAATAAVLKGLREELDALKAPAPSKVLSNGAPRPLPHDDRGLGEGAPADIAKSAELRAAMEREPDAVKREQIAKEMNGMASDALAALRAAGPTGRG
jgi:hypothetical protein